MKSRIGAYVRQHHLALLCLFLIVGGGTAWALERNSVRSKHIVNEQVKARDIAEAAVGAAELDSLNIVLSDAVTINGGTAHNGAYTTDSARADCPAGQFAISGGASWSPPPADAELFLSESEPVNFANSANPQAWTVTGGNDSGVDAGLRAWVVCLG